MQLILEDRVTYIQILCKISMQYPPLQYLKTFIDNKLAKETMVQWHGAGNRIRVSVHLNSS